MMLTCTAWKFITILLKAGSSRSCATSAVCVHAQRKLALVDSDTVKLPFELLYLCLPPHCLLSFLCLFSDNLFGTCGGYDELSSDGYRYELSENQFLELESTLQRLVSGGYTWHHLYTQCMLAESLSAYRRGLLLGNDDRVCRKHSATKSHYTKYKMMPAERTLGEGHVLWPNYTIGSFNSKSVSHSSLYHSSNVDSRTKAVLREAYLTFAQFLRDLSAEDLRDLKEYLLEESLRDVSGNVADKSSIREVDSESQTTPGTLMLLTAYFLMVMIIWLHQFS